MKKIIPALIIASLGFLTAAGPLAAKPTPQGPTVQEFVDPVQHIGG